MFTGIVTEVGEVVGIRPIDSGRQLTVAAGDTSSDVDPGDSVSVNGVCLTVVERTAETFSVQVVEESLSRTTLGELVVSSPVNLERPMTATGRFDGHIVQGHVDGIGVVVAIAPEGDASRVRIEVSRDTARYIVEKGSITIDGTSLTVTGLSSIGAEPAWFEVVLIPHTLDVTVFGTRSAGSRVNLEVDVIAKYVERLIGARS